MFYIVEGTYCIYWKKAHAPPFSMDRQVQREGRLREMYGRCCEMVGRRGGGWSQNKMTTKKEWASDNLLLYHYGLHLGY